MPTRTVAALIAIYAAASAPFAAQRHPADDRVVGCYRLELGEWGPARTPARQLVDRRDRRPPGPT